MKGRESVRVIALVVVLLALAVPLAGAVPATPLYVTLSC